MPTFNGTDDDYPLKMQAMQDAVANVGGPNLAVNGAFDLARKASSAALTNAVAYNALDMWWAFMQTTAAGSVSQVASPQAGFSKAAKLQRTASSSNVNTLMLGQTLESADALRMQGQSVTLSFYASAGANFSASGGALSCAIDTGTGTDQSGAAQAAGTWTGQATTSVANGITSTPARHSITVSIPANATQVGYRFYFTPTGTAGADDSVTITGVRLRVGSVVSDVDHRNLAQELAICQRCYRRIASTPANNAYFANGPCTSTTTLVAPLNLIAGMRAAPTMGYSAVGDINVFTNGGSFVASAASVGGTGDTAVLNVTVASGFTVGQDAVVYVAAGTGKFIDFSAYL